MDGVINVRCEAGLLNCIALLYTNNAIREKFITILKEGKHKLYVLLFVGQHIWSVLPWCVHGADRHCAGHPYLSHLSPAVIAPSCVTLLPHTCGL